MARIHQVPALLSVLAAALAVASALEATPPDPTCRLEVIVDGRAVPEYRSFGTRYVEAIKGKEYSVRLHNPLDVRVAVALSVDGLNTIDARRTSAAAARKWVIGPHETITISGWQVSMAQARRFYFTSEEASYAQRLGQPANIGVISAVFFKEKAPAPVVPLPSVSTWPMISASIGSRGKVPASDIATRAADAVSRDLVAVVSLDHGLESTVPVPWYQ